MYMGAVDVGGLLRAIVMVSLLWGAVEILASVRIPKPPWGIRLAVYLEQGFGVALFLSSFVHMLFWPIADWIFHPLILASVCLLGLGWTILATYVLKGSEAARQHLTILCIIRALTILGALPSAISLYLLHVPEQSKAFFKDGQDVDQ